MRPTPVREGRSRPGLRVRIRCRCVTAAVPPACWRTVASPRRQPTRAMCRRANGPARHATSRHTARGSQFPLRAGPTITSVSVTRGSGAVNARRPIHALRPRVPRGLVGIDGASAPRRPGVYVMAAIHSAGGKSQDGAARRRRQDRPRRPPGPERSDRSCTRSSPAPDSKSAGRTLDSNPLHTFSTRGIDIDEGVPMLEG